jgi:radical SAM superfamily enzyme YgiQ (UPF0313 family)
MVNPASRRQVYQNLGVSLVAIQPPVWAALLATYVRRKGFSVQIVDAEAEDLPPNAAAERILQMHPSLVCMVAYGHQPSASTQVMPGARAICEAIRQQSPQTPILMLGGHVAALPERTMREEPTDYVCTGEGPTTVVELLQALQGGRSEDIRRVRGLMHREDGKIVSSSAAPLVTNLQEEMPDMAWDLLKVDKYRAHNWHAFGYPNRQPYGTIYTTLGCPYHCTFCCIQAPFKSGEGTLGMKSAVNSYRFWPPEVVIQQIDMLVKQYGVKHLRIADEMFVLNRRHVEAICDLLIERGYDLNIWAYARVDTIKDGMVEKLKRAGINWLALGIESASERVRKDVQKDFNQDLITQVVRKVRDGGINIIANYVFGLPEDDIQSMQETLDMAMALNCEFANFYSAMAYPGSQLYQLAGKKGWPVPSDWIGYSQHAVDTLPLPTNHLTGPQVLRFRDQAFNGYFAHPAYLAMVERKFGPETRKHILEMTSHRLERKYA